MNYKLLKPTLSNFIRSHPGYMWFVLEVSMLVAGGYSLFGLILVSTGALAAPNTLGMIVGFILAPVYALLLFGLVTLLLTTLLTLPYAMITTGPGLPFTAKLQPAQAKPPRKSPGKRRKATPKSAK